MGSFEQFFDGYIGAALFASNDESDNNGGDPFDENYGADDIAEDTRREMWSDARAFFMAFNSDIAQASHKIAGEANLFNQAGHDFWMTRCGHGVGFLDGDWSEPFASQADKAAKSHGDYHLYVGDDGLIHGACG